MAIVLSEGTVLIIAVHTFGTYSVSYSNYSSVVRRYSVNGNSTLKKYSVLIVTVQSERTMSNVTNVKYNITVKRYSVNCNSTVRRNKFNSKVRSYSVKNSITVKMNHAKEGQHRKNTISISTSSYSRIFVNFSTN